jgi:pyruvate ferredoxin oxidoreductase delta subunit
MTEKCDEQAISMSRPAKGEAGATGDWRSHRPVLNAAECTDAKQGRETCQRCWVYCPDACISRGAPPLIDLAFCKGCGICSEVCPSRAIGMVPETVHAVCEVGE